MKKLAFFASAALATAGLFAEVTITGVTARQRWPWNSLVDVDFNVDGAAEGETFRIDISGTTVTPKGTATLNAKTFTTEPIAKAGANRVVWDFGADYPDTKVNDLLVTVMATPYSDSTSVYLVIDISGGKDATKWPVRYTTTDPVHTAGVEDPCKTTEIWLKRVKAGQITMGYGDGNLTGVPYYPPSYTCILTNDYYLGIFPVTQAQSYNMTGSYNSNFTNGLYRATRPVDSMNGHTLQDPLFDANNIAASVKGFNEDTVLGRLRIRTGLCILLPTQWQWEYACRAGTASGARYPNCGYRNSGNSIPPDSYEWKDSQRMWSADYGTSYVDAYEPNAWGFYSMIGNVWEICLNREKNPNKGDVVYDPLGGGGNINTSPNNEWVRKRAMKGGSWNKGSTYCAFYTYTAEDPNNPFNWEYGFRLCLPVWDVK